MQQDPGYDRSTWYSEPKNFIETPETKRSSAAKFGVETKELDDGLEVYGKPIPELRTGVSVHCYDDHRVAMAFSVLGTVIKETVLEEKRCVEKTWPNWWDDLENKVY